MTFTSRWARSAAYGLAGIVGLAGVALANPHGEGCDHPGQPLKKLEGRLDDLGLAPDTLQSARALLDKAREEGRGTRGELKDARDRMRELMLAEKPDVNAVLAQIDTIGGLETGAKKARIKTILELRSMLTPDQWAKLHEPLPGERQHHRKGRPF